MRASVVKVIAIIPARSGSKGLKNKNIIDLNGKPMLAYSIEAAKKSEVFDKIVVSTDSKLYKDIAEAYGANVLMRGEDLSNDTASSYDVIKDVLAKERNAVYAFVLLQPTSPARSAEQIKEAWEKFVNNQEIIDFLVSVKESEHCRELVHSLDDDGLLKEFSADFKNYRRQAKKDYSPNGAIFIAKSKEYLEKGHFFGERSLSYIMDKMSSVDVDDEIDYELAKIVLKKMMK